MAFRTSYSKNRIRNPDLWSQLTNKIIIDLKSFCLFTLVSITDSDLRNGSDYTSQLHYCVKMKLVYKHVFSSLWFCFFHSLPNTLFTCLSVCSCFPFVFLCFISLVFPISISCKYYFASPSLFVFASRSPTAPPSTWTHL